MASEPGDLPVVIAAAVPILAMQVGVGFLRFQVRRKRGVRRFRRALIRGGLPKDQAARLAQAYHDAGSLRLILRGAGFSRS
jgi:hypothetical protein